MTKKERKTRDGIIAFIMICLLYVFSSCGIWTYNKGLNYRTSYYYPEYYNVPKKVIVPEQPKIKQPDLVPQKNKPEKIFTQQYQTGFKCNSKRYNGGIKRNFNIRKH